MKNKLNPNNSSLASLILFIFIISIHSSFSQTSLEGKVTDAATGEAIIFCTIGVYKMDSLVFGTESDLDGNYYYADIASGTYDIEVSYIGYTPQKTTGVTIKAGNANRLDFAISEGVLLDAIEIINYKMPLIKIDNTTSRNTLTAKQIKDLPTKSINAIAATSAGMSTNQNESISTRGNRARNAAYYIDGVRVSSQSKDTSKEEYTSFNENEPKSPFREPLSTFSIDVDRASYSNVRRFLKNGQLPPSDAVRIEEMINYFNYNYPAPVKKSRPFEVFSQLTYCPWNENNKILHIGIQGRKIETENLPASNLVFLIDVSGSMNSYNKLPLVKESFNLLVENLRPEDRVAIVTYAGNAGIHLPSTPASQKATILKAIESLGAGGSTAGAEGILTAYKIAKKNFKQNGNNRVILATDGDFNVGISEIEDLELLIEKKRKSGVFLSVLGYGMGNYREGTMQSIANKGNGNHAYIDDLKEAKKVLVEEFGGTLFTIAKDVKVQVEFNPAYVESYRLIGYENRKLNAEDFTDDTKDAGELGAGHSVTALYEITPAKDDFASIDNRLLYQKRGNSLKENKELANVSLRYKAPGGYKSWEIKQKVSTDTKSGDKLSEKTKHAMTVAEFGMILRDSKYKGTSNLDDVLASFNSITNKEIDTEDIIQMVEIAKSLSEVK